LLLTKTSSVYSFSQLSPCQGLKRRKIEILFNKDIIFSSIGILQPRVPVTSNAVLFHRWYAYRDERTSSSSSDSGVASLQFSPPHLLAVGTSMGSAVVALSPPGLSPLHVQDSAFSTPTPSSSNTNTSRFTFDHIPYRRNSEDQGGNSEVTSAFDLPSSSGKDPKRLKDVLKTIRQQEDVKGHPLLQRKESVIQSTRKPEIF
ncbi:hypothetical protein OESDEN_17731, partial [Oesophagostomum dentatum]